MTDATNSQSFEKEPQLGDYFALMKPRVMQLVVFTAVVGMLAAPVSVNPVIGFASILFLAIGAGASGALNMWWDADIDAVMKRTINRPIPAGKVTGQSAMYLGCALSGLAVMMLSLSANLLAGFMLAFTIFFYVVPYTMWLKRSTPQNIVIGGAAGAFPPVIGWVIATGSFALEPWLMFALIFMWTPPHFWALALFMRNDYDDAKVPMLTVTHGRRSTRNHILAYTVLLAVLAVGTAFSAIGGWIYLATALVLNLLFLKGAYGIWKRDEEMSEADNFAVERRFFMLSLWYLFAHFVAILIETILKPYGLGGW
ncbi:protoheme IX farnesyltransferase [Sulfitobacter undariae]|uniref:Protoheme IX farnesyltransferase n=1 Tax=Sulfitobacter undariae TaxID=1563671 RepID=A0A7W6E1A3_9RHOB|nr:heme o synthase [Sulfitobacter undariae]MBB3992888.1 protoheme IX farnesyltransferase [Sulfitobacter undariae]